MGAGRKEVEFGATDDPRIRPEPSKESEARATPLHLHENNKAPKSKYLTANIQSAVNRAMYQEKIPHFVKIQDIRRNDQETITGVTTPTASAKMLMNYKDTVIRAARTVDAGIVRVEVNEIWRRLKIQAFRWQGMWGREPTGRKNWRRNRGRK